MGDLRQAAAGLDVGRQRGLGLCGVSSNQSAAF